MLQLTPEMLEAVYELLRTTPPFRGWKLPHSDEIEFRVTHDLDLRGWCQCTRPPRIGISNRVNGHVETLIRSMAHEMVHLYEGLNLIARDDVEHSTKWKSLAKQVCRHHGFDEKLF